MDKPPKTFISASAIGYSGPHPERKSVETCIETSPPIDSFTHKSCDDWETAALEAEVKGVRVCLTRLGVFLGKKGRALDTMLPIFHMGFGGRACGGK